MAKRSRANTSPTDWVKLLDADAIDVAWAEVVVDADFRKWAGALAWRMDDPT